MNATRNIEGKQMRKSHSTMSIDTGLTRPNSLANSSRYLDHFGKKKSRVSLLLNQIESNSIQEYEEFIRGDYEDDNTIPHYNMDIPISFTPAKPQTINIKINIFIEMGKSERIFTLSLQVQKNSTIADLIALTVEQFNQGNYQIDIMSENKTISFELRFQANDFNLYGMYTSKKNSKPKLDMPQFAPKTSIENTFTYNFSFVFNKDSLLMRKIGHHIEHNKEKEMKNEKEPCKKKGGCTGCIIM